MSEDLVAIFETLTAAALTAAAFGLLFGIVIGTP